jgi:anti-anti-sigma regulatory factor
MLGICEASVEVDLFTAPAFAAAMRAEIDWADNRAVFIDCSAITSLDRSAVHALVYANRYAIDHGHLLVIRNLRPNCARVIHLCDSDNELTIEAEWDSSAVPLVAFALPASKRRPTPDKARRANRRSHAPRPYPRGAWCGTTGAPAAPVPHVVVPNPTPHKELP